MSVRYVAERRDRESVVIDRERKEVFCRVLASDSWADADFARCRDIADMFNRSRSEQHKDIGK